MVVGDAQPQSLSQPQPQPQPPTATPILSAEEEALKTNTDCVYFLASPLTCKKGSECEYRHSDIARVNPRDCWFWLNGNCLNPKCGFRHPPLDGLLGTQAPTPASSSLPPSQAAATPAVQVPHVSAKGGVPCIFYQKGFCLKGDRCPFLHGPNSTVNNKISQAPLVATPSPFMKAFPGLEKCSQEPNNLQVNFSKPTDLPSLAKPAPKVEATSPKNGAAFENSIMKPSGVHDDFSGHRSDIIPPNSSGNSVKRSSRVYQSHISDDHTIQKGKDADEFSREPSPGFDVLVDDELRGDDYYHNEDQFGTRGGHDGRNLNPMNEYDDRIGHSADFNSIAEVDLEMYRDPVGYESFEHLQGQYAWEQKHRGSSERMPGVSAQQERRRHPRADSLEEIGESDLRNRLSKQRRVNGLRSVISHGYPRENRVEDGNFSGPQRENNHVTPHEGCFSSRLRGRIKIPGRSLSPVHGSDFRSEREMDRGRNRAMSTHQRGLLDRVKGRAQADFNNDGRNLRGKRVGRDTVNDANNGFASPKSLAELKVWKSAESNEHPVNAQHHLGKRKYPKLEGHQKYEGALSFEGPMPLSEILKRKRGTEITASGRGITHDNNEENNMMEIKEDARNTVLRVKQGVASMVSKSEISSPVNKHEENTKSAKGNVMEDVSVPTDGKSDGQPSLQHSASEPDIVDGIMKVDAMEDHDPEEGYDQGDGDYDYDGEDYNLDENADPEEEDFDDDDGDEFAKKMGVILS